MAFEMTLTILKTVHIHTAGLKKLSGLQSTYANYVFFAHFLLVWTGLKITLSIEKQTTYSSYLPVSTWARILNTQGSIAILLSYILWRNNTVPNNSYPFHTHTACTLF